LSNQTRIFPAHVDLDAHQTLARHPRPVTREGGSCSTGHLDDSIFPESLPESWAREQGEDNALSLEEAK
jgi:hypothetical protein